MSNSSKSHFDIYKKLEKLEIYCLPYEVYNSAYLTAQYLKENDIDNLFVIGSSEFIHEIQSISNIKIVQGKEAKNLVVGMDFSFDYEKIEIALSILKKGGKFIVCNENNNFSIEEGKYLPGCGAMVGAIIYASLEIPDFIVGKPNVYGLEKISKDFNVTNKEMIVVGDSIDSDIRMAVNYGCKSILINKHFKPISKTSLIFDSIVDMLKHVKGEI